MSPSGNNNNGAGGVYQFMLLTLGVGFDALDLVVNWIGLTGVGLIALLILDLLRAALILFLQLAFEGFSFKTLFKSWGQAITIIISFVCEIIIGIDFLPGWLVLTLSFLFPHIFKGRGKASVSSAESAAETAAETTAETAS